MRRGGFTLIEMMIALSISAVMLSAVVGMLSSVWTLAKDSSDELQAALRARSIRERLFYALDDKNGKTYGYGLISATNISYASASYITAYPSCSTNMVWSVDATESVRFAIDPDRSHPDDFLGDGSPFEYVFLKVKFMKKDQGGNELPDAPGNVIYHDRLVVPKFGRQPSKENLVEAIGGRDWRQWKN